MTRLKEYGTEGPLGFPMQDRQARQLDRLLKTLPKGREYEYRRRVKADAPSELNPGERSDVSWISTEVADRANEVVISKGMNDSQFQGNPIVTLNHAYFTPPVGRSLWRKRVKDGDTVGIKAKTQYPAMPTSWPQGETWPPDVAFSYVQAQLLNGKSIGFLPLKVHYPDAKEAAKNEWPSDVLVIDEWLLLEYAVCMLPCNQEALTEMVSKAGALPEWMEEAIGAAVQSKGAVPFKATPKAAEDRPWDRAAAENRLKEWAGGEEWDAKKYRQGFAYVEGDGSKLSDYKLPHHDIIEGELKVVWHGVAAAYAAVNGARADMNLSEEDKGKVKKHLEGHYKQFGKEPPKSLSLPGGGAIPYTSWAEVERIITSRISQLNVSRMVEKAVQEALDRARGRV